MLVQQILNGKPDQKIITVSPDDQISEAAKVLSENRIGALMVSSNGTLVEGILSERDIVRELGRRGAGCLTDKVASLMTTELVTCTPDTTDDKVMADMTAGRFRHMPVLDGEALIGVISIGDVVKSRMDALSFEKDALQDMIMGR